MTLGAYSLSRPSPTPKQLEAVRRIKDWIRASVGEGPETVVSVTEIACARTECAPRETVILVLSQGRAARKASLHKPIAEITEDDIMACSGHLNVML